MKKTKFKSVKSMTSQNTIQELLIPEKLMTIEECAKFLQLSLRTMYQMCTDGTIPNRRIGKQWRFDPFEIMYWFRKQKIGKVRR